MKRSWAGELTAFFLIWLSGVLVSLWWILEKLNEIETLIRS